MIKESLLNSNVAVRNEEVNNSKTSDSISKENIPEYIFDSIKYNKNDFLEINKIFQRSGADTFRVLAVDDISKHILNNVEQRGLIFGYDRVTQSQLSDDAYGKVLLIEKDNELTAVVDKKFKLKYAVGLFYKSHFRRIVLTGLDLSELTNTAHMFADCIALKRVHFGDKFNTDKVTDMQGMFNNCHSLLSIDTSNFNTSKVQDMSYMFASCGSLEELDISNFDTSEVLDMRNMFTGCEQLMNLDISKLNTVKVTDMSNMFSRCYALKTLDFNSFDTSQVKDMHCMFEASYSIEELDLSTFSTSQVENMYAMFNDCTGLEKIDISSFDTTKVTDMSAMFANCESLSTIDISNINISDKTNINDMFTGCIDLVDIHINKNISIEVIEKMQEYNRGEVNIMK